MNIRWGAVAAGVLVDMLISTVLSLLAALTIGGGSDQVALTDPVWLGVSVVLTTVSGYVAGRMGKTDRTMHGLLVQVVNILLAQLGGPLPRQIVLAYLAACVFAALGGFLSRFPSVRSAAS
ncbi:MAG: TIGR04086 family membrane protein [Roseiflexaceae bacterium]